MNINTRFFLYKHFLLYRKFSTSLDISSQKKIREIFDETGKKLNVKTWEDWYKVSRRKIVNFPEINRFIQIHFSNSFSQAIMKLYPEHPWLVWKFLSVPKGFWRDQKNQRKFFESLGKELNIKKWEDWYQIQVSNETLVQYGGASILYYHSSVTKAIISSFPEYNWKIWKFAQVPQSIWEDKRLHKEFFDTFAKETNLKNWEEWYNVTKRDIELHNGVYLLFRHYEGSLVKALISIYPQYKWEIGKFIEIQKHREFLDALAMKLGFKEWEDWYQIKMSDLNEHGGTFWVLQCYGNSMIKAITSVYYERPWRLWRFSKVPHGFWDDLENIRKAIQNIEEELQLKHPEEWNSVSISTLDSINCPRSIFEKRGGIKNTLKLIYPEINWEIKPQVAVSKEQSLLFIHLKDLFADEDIHYSCLHPTLQYSSGRQIELDVYVPSLNLAFEYQGRQHYDSDVSHYIYSDSENLKERDAEKKQVCEKAGITLIEIPYWKQLSKQLLKELIKKTRPDIFLQTQKQETETTFRPLAIPENWKK